MRLLIQSDSEAVGLFKELELLTNAAEVTVSSIKFDESRMEVTIPLKRRSYERKPFLFFGERYQLLSPEPIGSSLIVGNVVNFAIKDNFHLPSIILLFGVNVRDKEIYLISAEEFSGVQAFEMSIKVRQYEIELRDQS